MVCSVCGKDRKHTHLYHYYSGAFLGSETTKTSGSTLQYTTKTQTRYSNLHKSGELPVCRGCVFDLKWFLLYLSVSLIGIFVILAGLASGWAAMEDMGLGLGIALGVVWAGCVFGAIVHIVDYLSNTGDGELGALRLIRKEKSGDRRGSNRVYFTPRQYAKLKQ